MRIGELSEASGVSVRSLRYYEQQGLVRARRTAGGWRDFDPSMVERVVMIQYLLAAGLCTVSIAALLPCLDAPPAERTGVMEELLDDQLDRLEAKRRDIERELELLRELRRDVISSSPDFPAQERRPRESRAAARRS